MSTAIPEDGSLQPQPQPSASSGTATTTATQAVKPTGGPPDGTFKWSVLTCRLVRCYAPIPAVRLLIRILPARPARLGHNATILGIRVIFRCMLYRPGALHKW